MKKLLKIEWLKIRKYRSFQITSGIFLIFFPVWLYGLAKGALQINGQSVNLFENIFTFSHIWKNATYWASLFILFIVLLIIQITTNEFQFRTQRQNLINGWSRSDYLQAKWGLILSFSLCTTLYVFLVGFAFGVFAGDLSNFPGDIIYLAYFWLLCLNYFGFALTISFFLKKSGLSIGVFFLYIFLLEPLLMHLTNRYISEEWGSYLPLQSSDELIPFPIFEMLDPVSASQSGTPLTHILFSIAWVSVYYFLGRRLLLRSDW